MPTEPVTREEFAALVSDLRAELAGVDEQRRAHLFKVPRHAVPAAWRDRPWAREYVGVTEVMNLTGYTRNAVVSYDSQARLKRAAGDLTFTYNFGGQPRPRRLMPPSDKEKEKDPRKKRHRRWMIGELALWVAAREDRQATSTSIGRVEIPRDKLIAQVQAIYERDGYVTAAGIRQELELTVGGRIAQQLIHDAGLTSGSPNAHSAADEQILDAAREAVKEHGASAGVSDVTAALVRAGVRAGPKRIMSILNVARLERIQAAREPASGERGAELESLRSDGLVTTTQIARAYGVRPGAVTWAKNRGNIKVAQWIPDSREGIPLYDPARLWVRADGGTGPVDKNSPLAAKIDQEGLGMGNWRTVTIIGTMSEAHARKLRTVLDRDGKSGAIWCEPYDCLTFDSRGPGLAGLGVWPAAGMNRSGNLAERGYDVEDVTEALQALVHVAPTMLLKVHCGGDWESAECVATISVGEGLVVAGKPEVATIGGPSEDQVLSHLRTQLARPAPSRHRYRLTVNVYLYASRN